MAREEKVHEVEELTELLSRTGLVLLADYRGLTVAESASLRGKLRQQGAEFRVAKNTLTRFAADKSGKPALKEVLVGPTAITVGGGDESALAKTLADFERGSKVFKIKGGMLGHQLLASVDVHTLANLPPRPVLLSQMVAGFQSPISGFVGTLGGLLGGLVGTLEARRQQLEEQGAAAS